MVEGMIHTRGKELEQRIFWLGDSDVRPEDMEIVFFLNEDWEELEVDGDNLEQTSTLNDVSTEPSGYDRKKVSFDESDFSIVETADGKYQADFEQKEIDVSQATEYVDSIALVADFESDEAVEDTHLIFSGRITRTLPDNDDEPINLGNLDTIVVGGSYIVS